MLGVRALLGFDDPYAGFDATRFPTDFQGWGSEHPFFETILRALRPAVIIEVGTWKGGSAIHMGRTARALGFATEIVCIDTWLGSSEHVIAPDPMLRASLRYVNGYPSLYYTFLSNVIAVGLQDVITPFPMASDGAATVLTRLGVQADFIYIDAAHEYEAALRDMTLYWPLLKPDGMMLCDDYGYSAVTEAACQFATTVKAPLYATYGKALISKRQNRNLQLTLDWIEA